MCTIPDEGERCVTPSILAFLPGALIFLFITLFGVG
jgi:hypothetical protein